MKTILKSTQLETPERGYIIDLIKQGDDFLVEIIQNVTSSDEKHNSIKIASSLLSELIKVLDNYYAKLDSETLMSSNHLSELDKQNIQRNYLKGVSLKNLALQFDQSIELIEMVLRNREIQIVDNTMPKAFYSKRKKSKKRSQ